MKQLLSLATFSAVLLAAAPAFSADPVAEPLPPTATPQWTLPDTTPDKSSDAEDAQTVRLMATIQKLEWQPMPQGAHRIDLKGLLKRTEKENGEILLAIEKITEVRAKQKASEKKGVFFFFNFLPLDIISGSEESAVQAAHAQAETVRQQVLLEGCTYYYELMSSLMARQIAYQAIQQGLSQLALNQRRFEAGETTSFEVMQTKTELVKRYQNYLDADAAYRQASHRLAQHAALDVEDGLYPTDLRFEADRFSVASFRFFDADLSDDDHDERVGALIKTARAQRPEFAEFTHRKASIEDMLKAPFDFNNAQRDMLKSSVKQTEIRQRQFDHAVEALVMNAWETYRLSLEKRELAQQQLSFATKALYQAKVSHEAGFNSNKDVLDAQVAYSQAQVNLVNALIDDNLSQLKLLYETGRLTTDVIFAKVAQK